MKRVVTILVMLTLVAALFTGCSQSVPTEDSVSEQPAATEEASQASAETESAEPEATEDETVYVYTFAHSMSEATPRHQSMLYFEQELEERTNGRIQVEIYPNGTMGTEAELMDMVKINAIQGTCGSQFEKANPQYLIYNMPFMFDSPEEFQSVLDSDFEKKLAEGAIANGYYIPATGIAGGYRQITNNEHPINTPEDLEGLKLRVPPLTPVIKTMEALKANPTQIAYNETYMALKTGVVDGQENPGSNIVEKKFYEVQEYMSIINYMICPECFFTNYEWYSSLPADLQEIFNEVAVESMKMRTETWLSSEAENLKVIEENCEVNTVSEENIAAFRELCVPVWDDFVAEGSFSQEDLSTLLEMLDTYRQSNS